MPGTSEEFGIPSNSPHLIVSLKSSIRKMGRTLDELIRAVDELNNGPQTDELAQYREIIIQQAEEIIQMNALIVQIIQRRAYQQWLQANAPKDA
jgi:hypothetical protein